MLNNFFESSSYMNQQEGVFDAFLVLLLHPSNSKVFKHLIFSLILAFFCTIPFKRFQKRRERDSNSCGAEAPPAFQAGTFSRSVIPAETKDKDRTEVLKMLYITLSIFAATHFFFIISSALLSEVPIAIIPRVVK